MIIKLVAFVGAIGPTLLVVGKMANRCRKRPAGDIVPRKRYPCLCQPCVFTQRTPEEETAIDSTELGSCLFRFHKDSSCGRTAMRISAGYRRSSHKKLHRTTINYCRQLLLVTKDYMIIIPSRAERQNVPDRTTE